MNDPTTNTDTSEGADEPITLRLRDIASWQLPELAQQKSQERPKRPPAILPGLPSLQRGAVWRPNQIELLWDSVMRGFPIGSMVAPPVRIDVASPREILCEVWGMMGSEGLGARGRSTGRSP
jgi:hypothetical protein